MRTPWTARYPTGQFGNVIYGAATADEMGYILSLAAQRGTARVYLTDSPSHSAPPSYFGREVGTILQQATTGTRLTLTLSSTPVLDRWDSTHYIT